ncbi:glycosyltransferase [Rhodothermus marinus]|uniref:glycosyltransferase n=1 Tax=Rhodothermus marinus TaxID=29549 RepID=UPI0037C73663
MKQNCLNDITVVIPICDRIEYFVDYLLANKWYNVRINLIYDGSGRSALLKLIEVISVFDNIKLLSSEQAYGGVARAISIGVKNVETNFFMLCGDDDYFVDYFSFVDEILYDENALFYVMPNVFSFSNSYEKNQYDRRIFHRKMGYELLDYIVRTGEIHVLCAGTCFRTADVLPLLPEPFFRVSEDFVLLARLCARYPERRIYVANSGRYMRRIHSQSLSNPSQITPEKMLMHIVSLTVGGYYLEKMGRIDRAEFIRILLNRGKLLQGIYGFGLQTAALVGGLLLDRPPDPKAAEAVHALNYLRAHRDVLPPELMAMLSDAGKSMLMAS